jgi:hypothetical protein
LVGLKESKQIKKNPKNVVFASIRIIDSLSTITQLLHERQNKGILVFKGLSSSLPCGEINEESFLSCMLQLQRRWQVIYITNTTVTENVAKRMDEICKENNLRVKLYYAIKG